MTEYLKDRNSKWGNESAKETLVNFIINIVKYD